MAGSPLLREGCLTKYTLDGWYAPRPQAFIWLLILSPRGDWLSPPASNTAVRWLMSKASEYQPDPKQGEQVVIDVVLADLRERAETGKRKYGTYLETNNGRNALWDAYQEAIDLVMYLRQALLEQERHLTTACTGLAPAGAQVSEGSTGASQ